MFDEKVKQYFDKSGIGGVVAGINLAVKGRKQGAISGPSMGYRRLSAFRAEFRRIRNRQKNFLM